jgi:hypothetical protein
MADKVVYISSNSLVNVIFFNNFLLLVLESLYWVFIVRNFSWGLLDFLNVVYEVAWVIVLGSVGVFVLFLSLLFLLLSIEDDFNFILNMRDVGSISSGWDDFLIDGFGGYCLVSILVSNFVSWVSSASVVWARSGECELEGLL